MIDETTRRLTAAFGPPEDPVRRRWRLAPTDPSAQTVTVMLAPLSGPQLGAAAWIFAPSATSHGIQQFEVRNSEDVERLVGAVQRTLGMTV